jgi:hypothetical protein
MSGSSYNGFKQNSTSSTEIKSIERVLRRENDINQILPDIVRVSLMDMSSLEKMSEKNQKSYVERFGNILMKNSQLRESFKHDSASMLNNRKSRLIQ